MTDINPYAPPEAALEQPLPSGNGLEDAMAGKYEFTISEVMKEAWELTKGFKATLWAAMAVVIVAGMALGTFNAFLLGKLFGPLVASIANIASFVVFYPLAVGIMMLGVRRAAGLNVSFSMAFNHFDRTGSALLAGLLTTVFIYAGTLAFLIPGIYLGVAYYMTLPLLGDRELSAWQAMEASRKAITKNWFSVAGLVLLVGAIMTASALPLGIGLIWTMPWTVLVIGVLYKRIFGVATTA